MLHTMTTQPFVPGKIFLAGQHGNTRTEAFLSIHTFHHGTFQRAHREPFGALSVLNEEALMPGAAMEITAAEDCYHVVLPLTGGLIYDDSLNNCTGIIAGEVQTVQMPAGSSGTLTNPFQAHDVRFLRVVIRTEQPLTSASLLLNQFDPDILAGDLTDLLSPSSGLPAPSLPFALHAGRFGGRQEYIFRLAPAMDKAFVFVLEGVFEVEGRLLHPKDGLALWDVQHLELEALSERALLLVLSFA